MLRQPLQNLVLYQHFLLQEHFLLVSLSYFLSFKLKIKLCCFLTFLHFMVWWTGYYDDESRMNPIQCFISLLIKKCAQPGILYFLNSKLRVTRYYIMQLIAIFCLDITWEYFIQNKLGTQDSLRYFLSHDNLFRLFLFLQNEYIFYTHYLYYHWQV